MLSMVGELCGKDGAEAVAAKYLTSDALAVGFFSTGKLRFFAEERQPYDISGLGVIPEPSTAALLIGGAVAVFTVLRRRKRNR